MHRRHFLRLASLSLTLVGGGVFASACARRAAETPSLTVAPAGSTGRFGERVVVLVELTGGNDGLNTVVPWADRAYYARRPQLAVPRDEVVRLDDRHGLHPALAPLASRWDAGELAVVHGLGYPEPNRSHFRSIEIVETGSDADTLVDEGWIARAVGPAAPTGLAADGIIVGQGDPGPLAGPHLRSLAMQRPQDFVREARRLRRLAGDTGNPALDHVIGVQNEIVEASRVIEGKLGAARALSVDFPRTPIGRQLEVAARLLGAEVPLGAIKVQHTGFDTHAGQPGTHPRLLGQLADALDAFVRAMHDAGRWQDVLVVTSSEFGRRVAENGSGGTDHGTAAPHFVLGGRVRGGLYGDAPDLDALDDNADLVHTTDFRSLYNTVATRWWDLEAPFDPTRYPTLGCV